MVWGKLYCYQVHVPSTYTLHLSCVLSFNFYINSVRLGWKFSILGSRTKTFYSVTSVRQWSRSVHVCHQSHRNKGSWLHLWHSDWQEVTVDVTIYLALKSWSHITAKCHLLSLRSVHIHFYASEAFASFLGGVRPSDSREIFWLSTLLHILWLLRQPLTIDCSGAIFVVQTLRVRDHDCFSFCTCISSGLAL